jgi:FkbM family methyltransferase
VSLRTVYLKVRITILATVQAIFRTFGLQIRRLSKNVDLEDPEKELVRLAGSDVAWIMEFGAADGRDSVEFVKQYPNSRVLALEPVPTSFAILNDHARDNPRIIAHQAAVSDHAGEATFFIASERDASALSRSNDTGSAFDQHTECVDEIKVRVTTIDEQCLENGIDRIDILKMDAQGAELLALHGATRMLNGGGIGVIYTEIQFIRLYETSCLFHEIWSYLANFGFVLHNIYNLSHNEHGQLCWGDAIFIHKPGPVNLP